MTIPFNLSVYSDLIAAAVAGAELSSWSYGHGDEHDAIRLPHPTECGETHGEDDAYPCWGDYPAAVVKEIERQAIATLAPGRTVEDGGVDKSGEYLILAPAPAAALGRLGGLIGGKAKSKAKTKAARANGAKGGRPNRWQADDGKEWLRVRILAPHALANRTYWECSELTEDGGGNERRVFNGIYDDDGERVEVGNAGWVGVRSKHGPAWL